ncbi:MAG: NAD/NADP octopine/nopaline dehydrogenase family protein [Candidatus Rokubacteria bacterium]|nr:NAD/NADP octopine/nopaline dehydrogenase family protein [Candidatus Rokubacteria bacterium]MBI3825781.1 NAD/NADP octopine/nopaline dehydrogenase family protein [Candidatus Rokubacteria bacterium]
MIVAVLGAGNGALATAGDLALRGHDVRLWARRTEALEAVRRAGGITFTGEGRQGLARLATLTGDMGEACDGAQVIVAPVPATAQADLARRLAPVLTARQVVLLAPGTLGTYAMARDVARAGGTLPFALVETGTLPYLARRSGPAEVKAPVSAANLPAGAFPGFRSAQALATVTTLYPSIRPCLDALDAALTNAGPVLHPPLVLLNLGAIDAGRFDIHTAGTTPSVRRLIETVDAERLAARAGWGYPAPHYEQATYYDPARAAAGLYGAGARAKLQASGLWDEVLGFEHRYVAEDVVLGLALLESAGRTVGADTPASSGLLQVFAALLGRRLVGSGRALEALGLGDLALREIRTFMHEGWTSPLWERLVR